MAALSLNCREEGSTKCRQSWLPASRRRQTNKLSATTSLSTHVIANLLVHASRAMLYGGFCRAASGILYSLKIHQSHSSVHAATAWICRLTYFLFGGEDKFDKQALRPPRLCACFAQQKFPPPPKNAANDCIQHRVLQTGLL